MSLDSQTLNSLHEDILSICAYYLTFPVSIGFVHKIKSALEKEFECKYPELEYKFKCEKVGGISSLQDIWKLIKNPIKTLKTPKEILFTVYIKDSNDEFYENLIYNLRPIYKKDYKRILVKK